MEEWGRMAIAITFLGLFALISLLGNVGAFRSFKKDQGLIAELNEECNENIELLREMEEVLKKVEVERKAIFDTLETLSKRPNLAVISNEQIQQLADILDSKHKNNWMN